MNKRKFILTKEQVNELQVAQMNSKESMTAMRYQAVRLYGSGYAVGTIQEICGCSRPSLMEWKAKYEKIGIAGLVDQRQGGNRAELSLSRLEEIQTILHQYKPHQLLAPHEYHNRGEFWGIKELAQIVEKKYAVRYKSASSYRNLFEKCDFSFQRPSQQYRSRCEFKVIQFEEELEKN